LYRHQLQKMFLKFFADDGAAGTFAAELEPGRWSPAEVQERLLKAGDADAAPALFKVAPASTGEALRSALG
jgi:hypothetical protein